MRFQTGISSSSVWGGRRFPPYAFTEQGVAMLSGVLNNKRSVQVNVAIMRAFIKLREMIASHHDLARKLHDLENKYDGQFQEVFKAINDLMEPPIKARPEIGFKPHKSAAGLPRR